MNMVVIFGLVFRVPLLLSPCSLCVVSRLLLPSILRNIVTANIFLARLPHLLSSLGQCLDFVG